MQDLWDFKIGYIISNGKLGSLPWGWELSEFIMVRNPQWFEDVSLEYMTKEEKLVQIKKHFRNLKEAHNWAVANLPALGLGDEVGVAARVEKQAFYDSKVYPAVEVEIKALEELGVDRVLSNSLFAFGGLVLDELVGK